LKMLIKTLHLVSLFDLTLGLATKHLVAREYRPKEHLILADCGIGADGNSKSRRMFYFEGNCWVGGGKGWKAPTMSVDVPWDGSYPWRPSGVSAKFENGDVFFARINDPQHPDGGDTVGTATHTYEPHPFECYPHHEKDLATLIDGQKCQSAFVCYHNDDDPAPPPPAPPQPTYVFKYTAFKEVVELEGAWTAHDIFKHAEIVGNDYRCNEETAYDLPGSSEREGQCKIQFACGPNWAKSMVDSMETVVSHDENLLQTWTKKIEPNCEDKVRVCNSPTSCIEVCKKWGPSEKIVTNVTRHGIGDLTTSTGGWPSHIEFTITCPGISPGDSCGVCRSIGAVVSGLSSLINPFFGFGTNLVAQGFCGSTACPV
jgi:hypothetical protein